MENTTSATNNVSLFDCLVAWVNTFDFVGEKKCHSANDFKDGLLISKCLNSIDPDYFSDEWLNKIKTDTNENWRLKLLNLNKILQTLNDYYSEILNYSLNDFTMPNLNTIVETNNNANSSEVNDQLCHLLQLVLGCAINCDRKTEFIQKIIEMNESTQHMLMTAIQDLMSKDPNSNNIFKPSNLALAGLGSDEDLSYQLKKSLIEVNRLSELKEDMEQKCKQLDKQVGELQEDKQNLLGEIEFIKAKLVEKEEMAKHENNEDLNKQILSLQQKLDTTLDEMYKLESEKEKFRVQYEAALAEQSQLIERNVELNKKVNETQSLRDEIDILKHTSDKVEKLESIIETYKIKLEEMADLKRQMKGLEENNSSYLQKILSMEDDLRRMNAMKSQIDMYKKQIQELHEKMLNDEIKMKKLEYEYKSMEEMCHGLKMEKSRLQAEFDLHTSNASFHSLPYQSGAVNINQSRLTRSPTHDENDLVPSSPTLIDNQSQLESDLFSSIELVNIPTEIREKIARISYENKVLKSKQNEMADEKLMLLQSMYEDEKQRSSDLQAKLNEASRQKIELEYQMGNSSFSLTNSPNESSTNNNNDDNSSKKNQFTIIKQMEDRIRMLVIENGELKENVEKEKQIKLKELAEMDERYRGYLEKAKYVIKSLDPTKAGAVNGMNQEQTQSEVDMLKAQLAERDKQIRQMAKENEKLKTSVEQEEQLIASAWYNLGAGLNRKATDERVASMGGNSFLSQQRHLPSLTSNGRRPNMSYSNHSNNNNRNGSPAVANS